MTPRASSTPRLESYPLAEGDLGIAQTIRDMQRLIKQGARDPKVRAQAVENCRAVNVAGRDDSGEILAQFHWVKQNFRFTKDPIGKELLGAPAYLLDLRAGDCDDYVVLLGALLESLGHMTRIVTVAADPDEPRRLSHVYLDVRLGGRWIPLDPSQPGVGPGWAPPRYFRKHVWGAMLPASALGQYFRLPARRRPRQGLGIDAATEGTLLTIADQFASAAASRIAHGPIPEAYYGATGNLTIGGPSTSISPLGVSTISPWFWIAGIGLLAIFLFRRR